VLPPQADGLDLKTNVLAAYVAAGLSREVPDLMAAMKISPKSSFEVRAHVRACGCACVRACAGVRACVWACVHVSLFVYVCGCGYSCVHVA